MWKNGQRMLAHGKIVREGILAYNCQAKGIKLIALFGYFLFSCGGLVYVDSTCLKSVLTLPNTIAMHLEYSWLHTHFVPLKLAKKVLQLSHITISSKQPFCPPLKFLIWEKKTRTIPNTHTLSHETLQMTLFPH